MEILKHWNNRNIKLLRKLKYPNIEQLKDSILKTLFWASVRVSKQKSIRVKKYEQRTKKHHPNNCEISKSREEILFPRKSYKLVKLK